MAAAPQNKFLYAKDLVCACPKTLSARRWRREGHRSLVGLNLKRDSQTPALLQEDMGVPGSQSNLTNMLNQGLMFTKAGVGPFLDSHAGFF
jgi:hypothetical protein